MNRNIGTYGTETDFYGYADDAERILNLKPYTRTRIGPGYPLTLAIFNLVIGDIFKAGWFLSIIAGAIFYFANYKIFSRIFDQRTAFLAFALVLARCISFQLTAATDIFAAAIASLCIYFFFCSYESKKCLVFSGLLAGFAYITRYNYIYLIAVGTFTYLIVNPYRENFQIRWKKLAIFILAFFCSATPWLILNYMQNGNPFYSENYAQIASTFFGEKGDLSGIGVEIMRRKFSSLFDVLQYDPLDLTINYLYHVILYVKHFCEKIVYFPGYLFFGAGTFLFFKKANKQQCVYLLFCATSYLILCLVWFVPRFYLALCPFGFLMVAIFFDNELSMAASRKGYRWVLVIVFISIASSMFWHQIKAIRYTLAHEPVVLHNIAAYMKTYEKHENEIMVARKPHLPFLLRMKKCFPISKSMTAEEFVDFAKKNNAKYILYTDEDARRSPILKSFENPERIKNIVYLIYHDIDDIHGKIYLYKIRENF
jgi:hypothetical protein